MTRYFLFSLEHIDKRKLKNFRGAHPKRYQPSDTSSVHSRARSHIQIKKPTDPLGRTIEHLPSRGSYHSRHQSVTGYSSNLQGMRTTADPFLGKQTVKTKKGLKEILQENDLYEGVISQITQRLALREAITNASD